MACSPGESLSFNRFTFIYADNGSGKTTFCNILRSLKTGQPQYVTGRKTLGIDGDINISFNVSGRNITFAGGTWSETLPAIEIFDEAFIADNIYTTNGIGHEHKRNLYQVIVGEEGVRLAREYERLDTDSRSLSDRLRQSESVINNLLLPQVTLADLARLTADLDIDVKIDAAQKSLSAVNELEAIRVRGLPTPLQIPTLVAGVEALLKESIAGLATGVSERIAEHLRSHGFGDNGERWLAVGSQHITNTCPFCAQDIRGSLLAPDLSGYFSESYKQLKVRIDTIEEEVASTFSDRVFGQLISTIDANTAEYEFWSRYCDLPPLHIDHARISPALTNIRQSILGLIEQKRRAILEVVPITPEYRAALDEYSAIQEIIATYNETILATREIIAAKKVEAGGADARAAERTLNLLITTKELHDGSLNAPYSAHIEISAQNQHATERKTATRVAVDAYTNDIIARYETRLNELLLAFHANFSVSRVSHDYRGAGSPRSSFQIVINDIEVHLGDAETPLDRPSFKNTLSSGDRSVLALAFFWAQLELKGNLTDTIVVLDDPFTSQDWFRRTSTAHKATRSRVAESVTQVILLSHDQDFLREAVNAFPQHRKPPLAIYALHRSGIKSVVFKPHDLFNGNRQNYKVEIKSMLLYMNEGYGEAVEIARKIRPTLETYLKTTYPDCINHDHELGVIVRDINGTNGAHPVFGLVGELGELNNYSRRWHHGGDLANSQNVNVAELQGYIRRTLRIVSTL